MKINEKKIRADVIKDFLEKADIKKAVCFSCGNATNALKEKGVDTLAVAPNGDMIANRWFKSYDFAKYFGGYFNATSGFLPFDLMIDIAKRIKKELGKIKSDKPIRIDCGSGETLICLKLAYPKINFIACYDNTRPETTQDKESPLYPLVKLLAYKIEVKNA